MVCLVLGGCVIYILKRIKPVITNFFCCSEEVQVATAEEPPFRD